MGKQLIIAEKPSVAAEIAKALGGFSKTENWLESETMVVSSAIGHLVGVDMIDSHKVGRSLSELPIIPNPFDLVVIDRTKDQYNLLKKLMGRKDIDSVVNACDAGREGELIFRLIYDSIGCTKPTKRMWLQSMTLDAIRAAYSTMKPGSDYDNLAAAARCRTEADWLVGINGSRAITKLLERQTGKSENSNAGRVQTPVTTLIVDRENEIRNFKPVNYWEIHGTFGVAAGDYIGKWFDPNSKEEGPANRVMDSTKASTIVAKCAGATPSLVTEESKPSKKAAPTLFDLTTLQREANNKFGMSAQQTLDAAQALYEKHKATSYPRTDSTALPEDYIPSAIKVLGDLALTSEYGDHAKRVTDNSWVKADKRIFNNAKISDHFAIIPTGQVPVGLSHNEARIYDLVTRRFLAVFHPAAEYQSTTRITTVADEAFKSSGRVLNSPGWLVVYGAGADDDDKEKAPPLVKYDQGESVTTKAVDLKTLQTKPPTRFTEADLLGAMENAGKLVEDEALAEAMKERGLGTPATRASIIEGLLRDKDGKGNYKEPYLKREGKLIVPTPKAMNLIAFLKEKGIYQLTSPEMTGEWEGKLRQIEKGNFTRERFMAETAELTQHIVGIVRDQASKITPKSVGACPKCGGIVAVAGRAYECDCGFSLFSMVAGRSISLAEVSTLLEKRVIHNLTGFESKEGKKFEAGLKFDESFKITFCFPEAKVMGACPKCKGEAKGDNRMIKCDCGWAMWREVAGRKLSDVEVAAIMTNGGVAGLKGFVGKSGKPFDAGLKFDPEFKLEFVFAPRPSIECPTCKAKGIDKRVFRIPKKAGGFFWSCEDRECKTFYDDSNGKPVPSKPRPKKAA